MANSNITLAQSIEWAKLFVFRRTLAQGNYLEPAISSANIIMQTVLGPPFRWRWNRAVLGFVCVQGQQDYTIFNWQANTAVGLGYFLVDSNGNSQQVTTAGTTGSSLPTWNTTTGQTTTDGSVVWINNGPIGIGNFNTAYNFEWIENASYRDVNPSTGSNEWKELYVKTALALDSSSTLPKFISPQFDDGNGNITFRLMPAPYKAYPVNIIIQQKPPVFSATTNGINQTWAPIPDEYSRLYNWGFLALMFLFADDTRFQWANQKFIANLLSTNQGLTEIEMNVVLNNWQQVTGQPVSLSTTLQQGHQGRSNL